MMRVPSMIYVVCADTDTMIIRKLKLTSKIRKFLVDRGNA